MAKKSAPRSSSGGGTRSGGSGSRLQRPGSPVTGANDRVRLELEYDRPQLLGPLFGQYDQNLIVLENRLGVYVAARGNKVSIEGEADSAARARDILITLYNRLTQGHGVDVRTSRRRC